VTVNTIRARESPDDRGLAGSEFGQTRQEDGPMRILAIERAVPGVTAGQFTRELAAEEARRVWELHQAGAIRELYFRADEPSAVLALECADVEAARGTLADLPLVAAGLIRFELVPLRAYPGFARLFEGGATERR
jgi:muconolactone delta-isomerase